VLFSPMAGPPRQADVAPAVVVRWGRAVTLAGEAFPMPGHAVVTSRSSGRRPHYALVCFSAAPLAVPKVTPTFHVGWLRNLVSGRPVGASQVTAVVAYEGEGRPAMGRAYQVALRARLVYPHVVQLRDPVALVAG